MQKKTDQGLHFSVISVTALPVMLLCLAVFWSMTTTYTFFRSTVSEIRGVEAIRHLYHAAIDLQHIRSLRMQQLTNASPDLVQQIAFTRQDFRADYLDAQWLELRAIFGIDADIAAVVDKTSPLLSTVPTELDADTQLLAYGQLIDDLLMAMLTVADRSMLVLDPQTDTYYLMDVSVRQLPPIAAAITELQAQALRLRNQSALPTEKWQALQDRAIAVGTLIDAMAHNRRMVSADSSELGSELDAAIRLFDIQASVMSKACTQSPCQQRFMTAVNMLAEQVTEVRNGFDLVFYNSTDLLLQRLAVRRDRYQNDMIASLVATLLAIAATLAITFHYARRLRRSYHELEQASETDPLTGIPNRRGLEANFQRAMAYARRSQSGFALGMLDIDFFKRYNDSYGHQLGDRVLQDVATAIGHTLQRGNDYYFRYGGEEFCFFIGVDSASELEDICNKLRSAVAALSIPHADNPPSAIVTVSVGAVFVSAPRTELAPSELIQAADRMLYAAKAKGRNRVEITRWEAGADA